MTYAELNIKLTEYEQKVRPLYAIAAEQEAEYVANAAKGIRSCQGTRPLDIVKSCKRAIEKGRFSVYNKYGVFVPALRFLVIRNKSKNSATYFQNAS